MLSPLQVENALYLTCTILKFRKCCIFFKLCPFHRFPGQILEKHYTSVANNFKFIKNSWNWISRCDFLWNIIFPLGKAIKKHWTSHNKHNLFLSKPDIRQIVYLKRQVNTSKSKVIWNNVKKTPKNIPMLPDEWIEPNDNILLNFKTMFFIIFIIRNIVNFWSKIIYNIFYSNTNISKLN